MQTWKWVNDTHDYGNYLRYKYENGLMMLHPLEKIINSGYRPASDQTWHITTYNITSYIAAGLSQLEFEINISSLSTNKINELHGIQTEQ